MKLKDEVSIVTGGGQGIGRAICLGLAREGSDVLAAGINPITAQEVSKEIGAIGRKSLSLEMDVSKVNQVKEMVETTLDNFGNTDILVNVAGTGKRSAIEDVSEEDWDRIIGINLKGTFSIVKRLGEE